MKLHLLLKMVLQGSRQEIFGAEGDKIIDSLLEELP